LPWPKPGQYSEAKNRKSRRWQVNSCHENGAFGP
jgi:hypothetical protein